MKYATAKTKASSPNAIGVARATISMAAAEANMARRTAPSSGSRVLVSQA